MEWILTLINSVLYILPFLGVFFAVVLFHELGHFWVARRAGVQVEAFSIGMGPEIAAYVDKKGTRWRIAVLPLGGYCRFQGEEVIADPSMDDTETPASRRLSGNFQDQPVGWRIAIAAAGPAANFILAIVIYASLFMIIGIALTTPRITEIRSGSPAEEAGLQTGDIIQAIDSQKMENIADVQRAIMSKDGEAVELYIKRDEEFLLLTAHPKLAKVPDGFGGQQQTAVLGVMLDSATEPERRRLAPIAALGEGVRQTAFLTGAIASYLGQLITGRQGPEALGGPIRIAHISAQMAEQGVVALLSLIAALSVSLGFLNLLPLPMLDGGHLLFYGIESVRGKPLSERVQGYGLGVGVALLAVVFVFVIWNDLVQLNLFGLGGAG